MYQIIDFESRKYTNGGTDSKEEAETLNQMLKGNGLKPLGIIQILSESDKPNFEFTKTNLLDISIDVANRIKEKSKKS